MKTRASALTGDENALASSVSLLGLRVGGAEFLETELGEPLAHVDGGFEALALNNTCDEASSEGVTCTIGVVDLVAADGMDGDFLDVDCAAFLCADGNGGVGALCEDDSACALGVLLWSLCNGFGNDLDVLGVNVV